MALLDDNYALLSGGGFQVATLIPDVSIEAVGQDALGITGFPVETGATLTDHSFKLPVRVEMTVGWSNSSAGTEGYIQSIYQQLLALQATRRPFDIFTARRAYRNMLMESLTDPVTKDTYSAMVPRITFRELIISRTQTARSNGVQASADPANQTSPEKTGSVVDRGTVSPVEVTGSIQPGLVASGTSYGGYDAGLLGLAPSGADASAGEFTFGDGTSVPGGDATGAQGGAPGTLPGNLGLFGAYTPNAFTNPQPFRI